jgi:hypothetical protein
MENNLTVPQESLPAEFTEAGSWGTEGLDAQDILIPKLLCMQGLSKLVADRKAMMGDMINSTTSEVVGNDQKPIEIIPILNFNTWVEYEKIGGKLKFKTITPVTAANRNQPIEEKLPNGIEVRRDYCINFYVLLARDAADPAALPYVLCFKRTSLGAGKKLATHLFDCKSRKLPSAVKSFKLEAVKKQNDQGTFYVFDVTPARNTNREEITTAYSWYKRIAAQETKVDNSDLVDPEAGDAGVSPQSQF